ncbi:hypothetical protein APZ41_013045 [Roseomonas mucosa]|uniref:Uncharacterized protein n=1 Tax=Roseomonas mucosa TaxID=207340 RepID=A0A1S8D572_9PROT|nr:hypothetical protein APZ41_013045 [Roseomonas mucosa]
MISEGGRQAVLKSRGSTGLTAAGVQAYIGGAIRRGARLSAEQVGLAAGRVRELIQEARSPAEASALRKLLADTMALRPASEAVQKAAQRDDVPAEQEPEAGADHAAELGEMEARTRRLLAKAPATERAVLEAQLAKIQAMRAALQRGAVVKGAGGGLHPLRLRALARAEAATRAPVGKASAGGGMHPLRLRALARAAGGAG